MQKLSIDMERLKNLEPGKNIILDASKENHVTTQSGRWNFKLSIERCLLISKKHLTVEEVIKITKL